MKATMHIGVVTESAITIFLYRDPGLPHTVIVCIHVGKAVFRIFSILCKALSMNTLRA